MASDDTLYCLCRQPYDGDRFMIECDVCKDWFHGSCVGVQEIQAPDIETFHCPSCQLLHGPLTLKKRRNWHRHDYSELDDGIGKTQSGTVKFVQELKSRTFPSTEEISRLAGHVVRKEYFDEHGFDSPILVNRIDGLGIRVPPPNFTILDVENYVGSMREIDVIDVSRQEDYKMLMREWTEYYNSPNRTKIFNVISLEFSNTRLADLVEPPEVVRQISWASTLWPENVPKDSEFEKPKVQRYCLMGVKDSYTDFHVDFGGTSVWYHVLRGEKIFFLIKPTPANLQLYENWLSSSNQSECFFGDQVDFCYKQVVKQGQTIFIPSGWIHSVLTPIDSLVFGGNFLHSYAIDMQIHAYDMEKRVKTPDKYLFPNFETVHWYAAKHFHDYLLECQEKNTDPKPLCVNAAKSLAAALKIWTHKRDLTGRSLYVKREFIPDSIQYGKLLKELNKVLKTAMQKLNAKMKLEEKKKKKKKKEPAVSPKAQKDLEDLHSQTQQALDKMTAENASKMAAGQKGKKGKGAKDKTGGNVPKLKMKIAKPGSLDTSVYDFDDEEEGNLSSPTVGKSPPYAKNAPGMKGPPLMMRSPQAKLKGVKNESPVKAEPGSVGSSPIKVRPGGSSPLAAELEAKLANIKAATSPALKLKLFNGKVVSGEAQTPAKFQLLGANQKEDPLAGAESDHDEEAGLIVDENPSKPKKKKSPAAASANAIKLKLSIKPEVPPGPGPTKQELPSTMSPPPDSPFTQLKKAVTPSTTTTTSTAPTTPTTPTTSADGDPLAERMNMPTIRGGLNGSIADILEASGYGTETDFKIDDDIGSRRAASPTMRDAIQGMLSMSRMTGLSPLTMDGVSPFIDTKAKTTIRLQRDQREMRGQKRKYTYSDDTGESMPTCFKDDDYVYPTLDLSDSEEDHVFKPRGRPKKDETWNPKAKLEPNAPKPERPHREGTRKESVESGLAAAAARLATQPPPKRQYIRKKPKTPKLESPPAELPSTQTSMILSTPAIPGPSLTTPIISSPPTTPVTTPKSPVKTGSKPGTAPASLKKPVKKGMATAKQRLGKILGMGKMFR